ncbi:MAG: DUF6766 family protein [Gammaproteobacteria bacterium]
MAFDNCTMEPASGSIQAARVIRRARRIRETRAMRNILRNNGLSIVLFLLFLVFLVGTTVTGHRNYNGDRSEHGQPAVSLSAYLKEGDYLEAVTENWESEFLQMAMFALLTVFLYQKGSAESKDPDAKEKADVDPSIARLPADAPAPLRHGKVSRKLYENSLGLAMFTLFVVSFWMHAAGGARAYNEEQAEHGATATLSSIEYMGTARFWFESFQNWQSEFLAIFAMVVLTVFLRQKGSPVSKPVVRSHGHTGSS